MEVENIDIKSVCRTCLLPSNDLEIIFSAYLDENVSFSRILSDFCKYEVNINDGLSQLNSQICKNCKESAINAYRFQQMCLESDRSLRMLVGICEQDQEVSAGDETKNQTFKSEFESQNNIYEDKDIQQETAEQDVLLDNIIYEDEETDDDEDQLNEDEQEEEEEIAFSCYECLKQFKSAEKLEIHLKKHQTSNKGDESEESDENGKRFVCKDCNKVYKRKNVLDRHRRVAHGYVKNPHRCVKCNKCFPYSGALTRHEILHSDIVEKSLLPRDASQGFICVVCGQQFDLPELFLAHIKNHKKQVNEEMIYTCKLCNDDFSSFSDIMKHSKIHIENATHQCIACKKLLIIGEELIDHFLRHKGMKPHACPVCDKSFLKIHKLNVHMRIHSEEK
jgi:uncharacterized Zn-finger protein